MLPQKLKDMFRSRTIRWLTNPGGRVSKVCSRRNYRVLAIETSCDDTCVAIIDRKSRQEPPVLLAHLKETLDSEKHGGIVPTKAHLHHQIKVGSLVQQALRQTSSEHSIDLVCVTRGPGMPGSLSGGLDFAKGLAVAWDKPLVGVHHMLGHLLISRMHTNGSSPRYPFVSLLVSGGHTIFVHSKSISEHEILCNTIDIAIGDSLDKCAREIGIKGNMIAKNMEKFINENLEEAQSQTVDMSLPNPLRNQNGRMNVQAFSFAPFLTAVRTAMAKNKMQKCTKETRSMAYQIQEALFEHLITKLKLVISLRPDIFECTRHLVCSGGVGANRRLQQKLRDELSFQFQEFHYPEPSLCTDNAVMIGWAGIEIFENLGIKTELGVTPVKKWPLSDLLNVPGWIST